MSRPILTVDYQSKTAAVTLPSGEAIEYAKQSDAWADFPELRPAPPSAAEERRLSREQRRERGAQNGYGWSRSGRR